MDLLEHQGKEILSRYGIETPRGTVVDTPESLPAVDIPLPWVLKAQVPAGGRMKAGGIRMAHSVKEARRATDEMLGSSLHGCRVDRVLVEEQVPVDWEWYLCLTIDRSLRMPRLLFSRRGGIEVEETGEMLQLPVNPLVGLQEHHLRRMEKPARPVARRLYRLFREMDCELAEINPLAVVDGCPLALDAKITVNHNALYRHPELPQHDPRLTPLEQEAQKMGLAFVQEEGEVGVIANGAGLTMATMDALQDYGARGLFLDLCGTDDARQVERALSLMHRAGPRVILLNLFGGITKCDTVARGVLSALEKGMDTPIVARIRGTNEEQARQMLADRVESHLSFQEAVHRTAALGRGS
ncbi:MAG: ADP-forming succinate--CoA ligase subunit beta [Candidatus Thermoplasmatota archaeon]|nr:ADP-forming succinate--CoA ligase subunit beta [Candidatus Thermoplasmatota archaeon]